MGVGGGDSFLGAFCLVFAGVFAGACSVRGFFPVVSSAAEAVVESRPASMSRASSCCGMAVSFRVLADDGSAWCQWMISIT